MNIHANFEHRAGSSQDKHEGESSLGLCDRLDRTRDNSQRQLPTDHDYAVPTREYQTDQSSLNLPRLLLALSSRKSKGNYKKHPHRLRRVDTVTPYQGNALIELFKIGLRLRQVAVKPAIGNGEIAKSGFAPNCTRCQLHVHVKCTPSTSDLTIWTKPASREAGRK